MAEPTTPGTPMRAYAPGGIVDVDGATGSQLGVLGDGRSRYTSTTGPETFVTFGGSGRNDVRVGADGTLERHSPTPYTVAGSGSTPARFLDSQ